MAQRLDSIAEQLLATTDQLRLLEEASDMQREWQHTVNVKMDGNATLSR